MTRFAVLQMLLRLSFPIWTVIGIAVKFHSSKGLSPEFPYEFFSCHNIFPDEFQLWYYTYSDEILIKRYER